MRTLPSAAALAACGAALLAGSCATLPDAAEPARSLAAAETAFAAQSVREDMRAAFLAHFAADGLFVRQGWTRARDWLVPRPAPAIVLDWKPVHVEAARSGDLGLSTGPWRITPGDKAAPAAFGQFVSIWTRAPGEPWRVAVDIGISHRGDTLWEAPLDARISPGVPGTAPLAEAEAAFARDAAGDGLRRAWANWGASDLRVYREGHPPYLGRGEVSRHLWEDTRLAWTADEVRPAASGEFGYARGHVAPAVAAPPEGQYLHVWRHEAAGWRLVLDVVNLSKR